MERGARVELTQVSGDRGGGSSKGTVSISVNFEGFPCPAPRVLEDLLLLPHRSVSGSAGNWQRFKKPDWMPIVQGLVVSSPKCLAKKDVDA